MAEPKLVRDLMTVGMPVCRDTETCSAVAARSSPLALLSLWREGQKEAFYVYTSFH